MFILKDKGDYVGLDSGVIQKTFSSKYFFIIVGDGIFKMWVGDTPKNTSFKENILENLSIKFSNNLFEVKEAGEFDIKIFSIKGELIYRKIGFLSSAKYLIPPLSSGCYIVDVQVSGKNYFVNTIMIK